MRKEKLVFIITHDTELIARVCTRCICLSEGSVEQEFPVLCDCDLQTITEHMRTHFCMSDEPAARAKPQKAGLLHPVTKLLFRLVAMVVISTSHNTLLFSVYGALLVMLIADGWLGMALRVIRIAETLSASAETRGIDLRGRKSNYISLDYRVWDILFTLLFAAAATAGLLF